MTEYEVCQQNTMACEQEIAKGIIGQKRRHPPGHAGTSGGRKCTLRRYAGTGKDHAGAHDQPGV